MEVGLGPDHIVLDGDPAPIPIKGHSPQFSAHVCCGQTAGWIKMSLDMEVGLGPGDILLGWNPAAPLPPKGGGHSAPPPPILAHACCGQTAGWTRIPLGAEVRLGRPGDVGWRPIPHGKGHSSSPSLFAVARSPTSATAQHLSTFHLQTHQ